MCVCTYMQLHICMRERARARARAILVPGSQMAIHWRRSALLVPREVVKIETPLTITRENCGACATERAMQRSAHALLGRYYAHSPADSLTNFFRSSTNFPPPSFGLDHASLLSAGTDNPRIAYCAASLRRASKLLWAPSAPSIFPVFPSGA